MTTDATPTGSLLAALVERVTAHADDELVLGHRDAEWTGHAPLLEEDIALANLAQDEIGHAITWYGVRSGLDGSDPDRLVYFRGADEYRSSHLVALPRGDWAFTMLRQYLFDAYETELLARLARSSYQPLAQAAVKIAREELFHLRHSQLWLERLAYGTDESRARLEDALAAAWPLLPQLLAPMPGDAELVAAGMWPAPVEVGSATVDRVTGTLTALGLRAPPLADGQVVERHVRQPPELGELLSVLQSVARADPEAQAW
mgnify:CR=1 FL=1